MAIKERYKQTEIGVIPFDWKVKLLGEVVSFNNGKAHEQFIDNNGEYIVINSKFISTEGDVYKRASVNLCSLNSGDITMVMSDIPNGRALAKCYVIPEDNKYALNQRICSLRSDTVNNKYLSYILNRNNYYLAFDSGTSQTNLKKSDVLGCPIPLPPTYEEQTLIANAITDAETLIHSLQRIIAKKRAIKQGTMQKLLKPKENWVPLTLGDLFVFSGGFTASRDQLSTNGNCYLHYGDIHSSSKTHIDVTKEFSSIPKLQVELNRISRKSLLNDGDVVFVDASEDDEGTSKHIVIKNPDNIPFISGLHTIVAKSKNDVLINEYKNYCFQSSDVKSQFKFYAVGTKVRGISKANISKIEIFIPPLEEQQNISMILSDMDMEIQSLEIKLEKYKQIKQGIMQSLLTGRIRLV